jgi:hypothetical protein
MTATDFPAALENTGEVELTTTCRAGKQTSPPVWFVRQAGRPYLLPVTGSDSQWYKTCSRHPRSAWPSATSGTSRPRGPKSRLAPAATAPSGPVPAPRTSARGVAAMSLSAQEQHALESIEGRLAESDPGLASRLGIFSRLASGEEMPARNGIQAVRPPTTDHLNRNRSPRGLCRRLGWNRAAVLLWLLTSVGLIAVVLALSNHDPGECVQSWGPVCAGQAPKHVAPP